MTSAVDLGPGAAFPPMSAVTAVKARVPAAHDGLRESRRLMLPRGGVFVTKP
jgi:hypothetical protein